MRRQIQAALVLLAIPASALFAANSLSTNGNPALAPFGQQALPENAVTITQSTGLAITAANSVSCNGGAPRLLPHRQLLLSRLHALGLQSAAQPPGVHGAVGDDRRRDRQ